MDEKFIRARALLILGTAVDDWLKDTRDLATKTGPTGGLGSDVALMDALYLFRVRSEPQLAHVLEIVSNAVAGRGRSWARAHEIVKEAIDERYREVADWTIGMGFAATESQREHVAHSVDVRLATLKAEVDAHQYGLTRERLADFPQRRPVLWALILLLAGVAVGQIPDFIKALL